MAKKKKKAATPKGGKVGKLYEKTRADLMPTKKGKKDTGKRARDCPAMQHETAHDRPFEAGNPYFNPTRPEDVGSRPSVGMDDAKRKKLGIGTPCDFGSWTVPNRRLNPNNKDDAKIIKRGMDSLYTNQTNPSCPKGNINKKKYNENCKDIGLGKKKSKKQEEEEGFERNGNKLKKKYG